MCEEACGAVSMLALRVPANAKQLVQDGAGQAVVRVMEAHPKAKQLQVCDLVPQVLSDESLKVNCTSL